MLSKRLWSLSLLLRKLKDTKESVYVGVFTCDLVDRPDHSPVQTGLVSILEALVRLRLDAGVE